MARRKNIKLGDGDAAVVFRANGEIEQWLTGDDDDNADSADIMVATVITMLADEATFSGYWHSTLARLLADGAEQDMLMGLIDPEGGLS